MSEYPDRIGRAREAMAASGVHALCLSVGKDLPYLTGYSAMPLERLTMLVLPADGDAVLVVPELEAPRVDRSAGGFVVRPWGETEDPIGIVDELLGDAHTVAIGTETWSSFVLDLQQASNRSWLKAGDLMRSLRIVKTSDEVDMLRDAGRSVDAVVEQMAGIRFSGRTEADVSREFSDRLLAQGHEAVDFAIVASGPNGASPHHHPGNRVIESGDAVVVDFGGFQRGYGSDTTRMFVVGTAPEGFDEAYDVLRSAQEAAVRHVRPGVTAESVDAVARGIISEAGFGEFFIHRTGHGIGMDTHEHPYLVEGNTEVLEPGMAFSVEPGIYIPGRWGMRLEDIVVVTPDGVERLNNSDRGYRVVE